MSDCDYWKPCQKLIKQDIPIGCYHQEWYAPFQIKYCPSQITWWMQNQGKFDRGNWPSPLVGSDYIDPAIRGSTKIPTLNGAMLNAEIETRLKMLPVLFRELLETAAKTPDTTRYWCEDARSALYFISGFDRLVAFCPDCNGVTQLKEKGRGWIQVCEDCGKSWGHYSFSQWKRQRNFREKERKMHVCSKCGGTRWKTVVKGEKWQCRKCGEIKQAIKC